MAGLVPCVFVETPLDTQLAKLLLPPLAFEFSDGLTMSGALGRAQADLLSHPKRPVALLVNAGMISEFMVDEWRAAAIRLMRPYSQGEFYVAFAAPHLETWARTDPRVARELPALLTDNMQFTEQVQQIIALLRQQPFDATALTQQCEDYRGLVEFLKRHAGPLDNGRSGRKKLAPVKE